VVSAQAEILKKGKMDYESKMISKAAQSGGIENLISSGISSRHFDNPQNLEIWDYLINHMDSYKSQPSFEEIKNQFPEYEFEVVTDSFDFIKDRFVANIKRREATEALLDLGQILDENNFQTLMEIDELFLDKARDLAAVIPTSRADKFSSMKKRIAEYKKNKEEGIIKGKRFGLPELDEYTLGIQQHEYVTIAGPSGLGKTTLGLWFNLNHYMDGHTPMIISLEMSAEEIYRKLDGMAAQLKQHAIKAMTLDKGAVERWEKMAERAESAANDIIVIDVDNATPEKIYAEAARWNPEIIMVDYIQLLEAPRYIKEGYRQVGHISKEMKKISRQLKIPVYGLSQTNSESFTEGAKLTNVSESRAIVHNSDIVLGLSQDEEQRAVDKLELRLLKNRGGASNKIIYMLWNHSDSEYREWRNEIDDFRDIEYDE
jgi:replicative DNA helicase